VRGRHHPYRVRPPAQEPGRLSRGHSSHWDLRGACRKVPECRRLVHQGTRCQRHQPLDEGGELSLARNPVQVGRNGPLGVAGCHCELSTYGTEGECQVPRTARRTAPDTSSERSRSRRPVQLVYLSTSARRIHVRTCCAAAGSARHASTAQTQHRAVRKPGHRSLLRLVLDPDLGAHPPASSAPADTACTNLLP
jgi:hypothetical protein